MSIPVVLRNRNKRGRASMAHWLTIAAKRYILIADGSARGGQQHQFLCPCVLARLLLQDPMHQEVTSKECPISHKGRLASLVAITSVPRSASSCSTV
jgi:hypothetical protein